jgi:hypothetical protein
MSGGGVGYKDYVQNLLACELAQLVNIAKRVFPTNIFWKIMFLIKTVKEVPTQLFLS